MAEYIGCRTCKSKNCEGCNMKVLEDMLDSGAFDGLMDSTHTIVPAADVVADVRCKDCEHNAPELALREGGIWCKYWGVDPDPDDWCSKGKRRADNGSN